MKVFIYTKTKDSTLTQTLDNVISVQQIAQHTLLVATQSGDAVTVDTSLFKTTIYQN